jgi:hypothetical protein
MAQRIKEFVNIGIITYGRLNYTKECIQAIWDTAGSYPFKITVINNFKDGEEELVKWLKEQYAAGRIHSLCLMTKNVGVAKAANAAWQREPNAKYFLKLDNDMVAKQHGWLDAMVKVFEMNPKGIGTLGYNVEPVSYPINAEGGGIKLRVKNANIGGACLLVSKDTEDVIGNFVEFFDTYGEEDATYHIHLRVVGKWNAYMEDEDAFFHLPAGKAAVIDTSQPGFVAKDGAEEVNESEYRSFKDSFRTKNVPKMMAHWQDLQLGKAKIKFVSNAGKDFKYKWFKP